MPPTRFFPPAFRFVLILAASAALCLASRASAQDPARSDFRSTVLLRGLSNPTSIAFLPDGRVYVTRKNGTIRLVNPSTGDTSTAANLPTANAREDGLHALVLDPAFASNKWVYVLMSERVPGDTALVVARYTVDSASGVLQTATKVTVLKVPYTLDSPEGAEHSTGTIAFGPDGNLYVALADNTQNIFSGTGSGYAPRDPARPRYDAQRTAANTNDLRGKILRIRPEPNGGYTIPAGNLRDSIDKPSFNPNWNPAEDDLSKVRPEIYVMGLRHPFRITVDPVTGWLYWAEPGPNASADNASQGPRGYEVVGLAKGPGNYGWPYCRANPHAIQKPASVTGPFCYTQYNYSGSGVAGPMYKPDSLRNTSPNNTGVVNLPPMKPTEVWYPYNSTGTAFPVFGAGGGGNAAMLGPVYRFSGALDSPIRLPKAFDRNLFLVEWQRSIVYAARLDEAGGVDSIRPFLTARDSASNGPIDLKIGPDGALYLLNWVGNNYNGNAGNGTLTRLEYTGVQVGVSGAAIARSAPSANGLQVFGAGSVFRLPAGRAAADFHGLRGEKLWSYRRDDASREETIALPDHVRGAVRVRLR